MELITLLNEQREFSWMAFGPKPRLAGVHEHLSKELEELIAAPKDLSEWADCLLLSFDGAMRAGAKPQELVDYMGLEDIEGSREVYRGSWHDLRRDVGYLKSCNHLGYWKAWSIIAVKFLVAATRQELRVDEVLQAARDKLEVNKQRSWPDWRTLPENQAIEHIKQ